MHQTREYKRFYPEGEASGAHRRLHQHVEDKGQEGVELAREGVLAGRSGARLVIKDRLGRVVEDVGILKTPRDGEDMQLSIDAKIQYLAYNEVKAVAERSKAKAASAVVLDAQTGEVLALANWPTYNPNDRTRLSGEQLRNRVLTDTFEPGSMMKPISIGLALQLGRVTPSTVVTTTRQVPVRGRHDQRHPQLRRADGVGRDPEVEQHRHDQDRDADEAAGNVGYVLTASAWGRRRRSASRAPWPAACGPGRAGARSSRRRCPYGYGLSVSLFQVAHAYTIFAHDGELIPVPIFKTNGPATGGAHPQAAGGARCARHARNRDRAGRHRARGPGDGLPRWAARPARRTSTLGRGYDRGEYRASVHRPGADVQPARDRGGQRGRAHRRQPLRRRRGGPDFRGDHRRALRALNVQPDSPIRQLMVTDKVQESEPWAATHMTAKPLLPLEVSAQASNALA